MGHITKKDVEVFEILLQMASPELKEILTHALHEARREWSMTSRYMIDDEYELAQQAYDLLAAVSPEWHEAMLRNVEIIARDEMMVDIVHRSYYPLPMWSRIKNSFRRIFSP